MDALVLPTFGICKRNRAFVLNTQTTRAFMPYAHSVLFRHRTAS